MCFIVTECLILYNTASCMASLSVCDNDYTGPRLYIKSQRIIHFFKDLVEIVKVLEINQKYRTQCHNKTHLPYSIRM